MHFPLIEENELFHEIKRDGRTSSMDFKLNHDIGFSIKSISNWNKTNTPTFPLFNWMRIMRSFLAYLYCCTFVLPYFAEGYYLILICSICFYAIAAIFCPQNLRLFWVSFIFIAKLHKKKEWTLHGRSSSMSQLH